MHGTLDRRTDMLGGMRLRTSMFLLMTLPVFAKSKAIPLFDGKSLRGWDVRPTSVPDSKGDWTVKEGTLACGGTTPSWISTRQSFSDYRLTLEFRGSASVNSGVFLRSQAQGQPHVTGYELQIWDAQPAGFNTGSLVGSAKASATKIKPDQWNKYDVLANGDHFVVTLNGQTLLDVHDSKHSTGLIGFQCQKDQPIQFRKIEVEPISKAK